MPGRGRGAGWGRGRHPDLRFRQSPGTEPARTAAWPSPPASPPRATRAARGEAPQARPGTVMAKVASERCTGCGRCVEVCPTGAGTLDRDGRASVRGER